MPLVVTCVGCQARLKVPDAVIGKSVFCPKCGKSLPITVVEPPKPAPPPPKKSRRMLHQYYLGPIVSTVAAAAI